MSTECSNDLKRTVPLYRVVHAAIIDTYEDIGKTQQMFSHWAARGLKKLDRESLKTGLRKVTLSVNRSTNTATLPTDFNHETGVWVIDSCGMRVPLKIRPVIVDMKNVEDIPCEDRCEKCNQDKGICSDLTVTEDTVLVTINNNVYEQTIIKKLYPNGDYYLETKIPVWNVDSLAVEYSTTKEFIASISLKPCGCVVETKENIEVIKNCCPDVYCSYFAGCDNSCTTEYGGYRVFEESGLIQFDAIGSFTKVYMEYRGFMPKKNGQYQVPEVAFEALVEWVKYKSIQNKRGSTDWQIERAENSYRRERGNMSQIMGRLGLSQIIQSIGLIPKFDLSYTFVDPSGCLTNANMVASASLAQASVDTAGDSCGVSGTSLPCKCITPFQIAVVAGNGAGTPVVDTSIYQNDALINAVNLNFILIDNSVVNALDGGFTFNSTTGTVSMPNIVWAAGQTLIIPFSKLL